MTLLLLACMPYLAGAGRLNMIEMPGYSVAALTAYPEYCKGHKPEETLRIMSYNIRNSIDMDGKKDFDRIAKVINDYVPAEFDNKLKMLLYMNRLLFACGRFYSFSLELSR